MSVASGGGVVSDGASDVVVVGSALVRTMHDAGATGAPKACGKFIADLRAGLDRAAGAKGPAR